MNPLEMLSLARGFLQRFSSPGLDDTVPPELVDGLALYENDLRKQVEGTSFHDPWSNDRTRQRHRQLKISNQTTIHRST